MTGPAPGPSNPTPPPGPGRGSDVDEAIRTLVDSAPRLTAEQRSRLSVLLTPAPHIDARPAA